MTRAHVLVCRGPDCAARGAQDVYTALADAVHERGLSDEVIQTQCGCVGPMCGGGPVVCCYPTGAWYAPVTAADAVDIVRDDLDGGRVVERLVAVRLEGVA
jgi:(2Fe-2S) ferredoxin